METVIEEIIKERNPKSIEETKAIIREILQSIVLIGLSRGGFFKEASFYGGTALRIFYGLNRYSEDLDFTLNNKDSNFSLEPYIYSIKTFAESYGFNLEINIKNKNVDTMVESAFTKVNTYMVFLNLKIDEKLTNLLHKDEVLKVKLEVDCEPSLGFNTVSKWIDLPEFSPILVLDEPSLFSGKLAAILCRSYKNHVKGRDYYDFLFFMKRRIKPNIKYLKNKLIENKKIDESNEFDINTLKKMLIEKFFSVDFELVKRDISRFLFKQEDISYITKDLFLDMVNNISD